MEKKTPNGHSVGETLGASCILLSKGKGTLSGLDIQMRKIKLTNSVLTFIPMVVRTNFKYRKLIHSCETCKLTSAGVKIDIRYRDCQIHAFILPHPP